MPELDVLRQKFAFLGADLLDEVLEHSQIQEFPKDTKILREGKYIKVLPLVIDGAIKVFTKYKDKELLLYYIRPNESCIMSFAASINNEASRVNAVTEVDTQAILLPISKIDSWFNNYPKFNSLFFGLYYERYIDMVDTINHLLFNKLDERVMTHLQGKEEISGQHLVKTTHRQIANELGTAREVISRIVKKLEKENKLTQHSDGIKLL
jgi:CRP/FNR family transcriptional regulator